MEGTSEIRLAVDAVVFGYSPGKGISVLLIQRRYEPFQEQWALPGGFVQLAESLEEAVERELSEETGLTINYLEQLYTFGKPGRDPRQRVVSVAYFVLIRPDAFQLHADSDAKDAQWFDIHELPELAFDHIQIVRTAIERLQAKVTYEPIGFELLDETFSFSDLRDLYESLLQRKIDRGNFQKKIKSLGILQKLRKTRKPPGSGRPAQLFRFDKEKYFQLKQQGTLFELWL